MGMINGLIKQLQDMLLLYGNKIILTISDGENEYDIKSITGKPCAKYFEAKDKVAEVTITVKPTVEAISKADYETRLKSDMVAMLEKLKSEIILQVIDEPTENGTIAEMVSFNSGIVGSYDLIQEKINALKENKDE